MWVRRALTLGALAILSSCSWAEWKAANITELPMSDGIRSVVAQRNGTGDRPAYAIDVINGVVAIDRECEDSTACIQSLGDDEFWTNHEYGHVVDQRLGSPQGNNVIGWERGANCVAEVVTGRGPNFTQDSEGYWNCPTDQVARTRKLMYDRLGINA